MQSYTASKKTFLFILFLAFLFPIGLLAQTVQLSMAQKQ